MTIRNGLGMSDETERLIGDENITLGPKVAAKMAPVALAGAVVLAVGLALRVVLFDESNVFRVFLTGFAYVLSLSLGMMFFVLFQHATRAGWSVTVRRVAELMASSIPGIAVLFIGVLCGVLLGANGGYPWTNAGLVAGTPLLRHKAAYLNTPFFVIRAVFYFAVWWWLARRLLGLSNAQEKTGDPNLTVRMERVSLVGLLAFAFTVTFASFDWFMSLSPEWFSTIYGVYYFAGAAVAGVAALILILMGLQATGRLTSVVTVEHYHDLGKLLFAFVIFWGYIAFSQYLLIWYANIPEETTWYLERQIDGWQWTSVVLLVGNLFIPFFGILSRSAKRCKPVLAFWAIWLLVFHWLDLYYLIMPGREGTSPVPGPSDALVVLGMAILWLSGVLVLVAGKYTLLATGDPRLHEALNFENH
jgi:hypothetical protein